MSPATTSALAIYTAIIVSLCFCVLGLLWAAVTNLRDQMEKYRITVTQLPSEWKMTEAPHTDRGITKELRESLAVERERVNILLGKPDVYVTGKRDV